MGKTRADKRATKPKPVPVEPLMAKSGEKKRLAKPQPGPQRAAETRPKSAKPAAKPPMGPPRLADSYRDFFEGAPIAFCLCLMNGDYIQVNQAYADLLGRTKEDLIGKSYQSFTPQKYKDEDQEQINKLQQTGQIGPFEKEYISLDGHLVPVRITIKKIEINNIEYIWVMAENVGKERYRVLFQEASVGLALCDWNDGAFVTVNEAFAKITGWTVDELLGRHPDDGKRMTYCYSMKLLPPELHGNEEIEQRKKLETDGRYGPYSKEYLRKDGSRVPVTLAGVKVRINDKDFI